MMRSGVNHLRLLRLLVCSMIFATSAGMLVSLHFTAQAAGQTVQVWLTTTDGANHLTRQADLQFGATSGTGSAPIIDVNDAQKLQQMDGFGAAVTDSSAWLLYNKMSTAQRNTVMTNLFGTNPNNSSSIGLSFVRIPMGASDFSVNGAYSYDDLPAGQTDPTLSHFSISHDTSYILPILQQAYQLNPAIRFMANPWSPPAWMKTNDSMIGTGNGSTGTLQPAYYSTLAQYFVKFIQAYQAAPYNIPIYAITPQNEPLYVPPDYPGMSWPASNESNFIKNNLAPALASANLHNKILGYDHDWSGSSYAQTLLSDPTTNNDLAGIAWHCYNGNPSAMTAIHNQYPTKEMYETECATGISITHISTINLLMQSVQNWARSVELWNIALDPNHGPHTGGCTDCNGVVTINQSTGNVTYSNDYYLLGQFSKFALPGAYHIASTVPSGTNVTDVAFQNPDGSKVVVANNGGNSSSTFTVRWDSTQSFSYTLPAGATVSFVWPGTSATATPTPQPTTPAATPTATPTPTSTPTPVPTITPTPTPTPKPTVTPTSTPTPTITPTPTPKPTVTPTSTPRPTVTPTPTPKPTVTPTPIPTSTPIPVGGCNVSYVVQNQWPTGFTGSITIENTNTTALNGWNLQFSFFDGQQVQQGWNGNWTQSGTSVTVTDASWNALIAPYTSITIGFNASLSGTNPSPGVFTLNGTICNTM